ncbi:MAG: ankyrin repeat domain-containing protein, partial [Gammaproteobacteria bacterium]
MKNNKQGSSTKSISNDKTLLYAAAKAGNFSECKRLLDNGANPFVRDEQNYMPADYAFQAENTAVLQFFVDQHCAIDVTWLQFPTEVKTTNKLMIGFITSKEPVANQTHIYNVKSATAALSKISVSEQNTISLRIQQYQQVCTPELRHVADHLQKILSLLPILPPKQAALLRLTEKQTTTSDQHIIEVHDKNSALAKLGKWEEFQDGLKNQTNFLENNKIKITNFDQTDKFIDTPVRTAAIKLSAEFVFSMGSYIAFLYLDCLGIVSWIGSSQECSESTVVTNSDNQQYTKCLAYKEAFSSNDWDNVEIAAIWPSVAFITILAVAFILCVMPRVDKSYKHNVLCETQQNVEAILELYKTLPALYLLLLAIEKPQQPELKLF